MNKVNIHGGLWRRTERISRFPDVTLKISHDYISLTPLRVLSIFFSQHASRQIHSRPSCRLTGVVGRLHAGEGRQETGCCHGDHWRGERLCHLGAT